MATTVKIGGADATNVQVASATSLTCVIPAGSVGAADVSIATSEGGDTAAGAFTYIPTARVTAVTPDVVQGSSRMRITLTGTALTADGGTSSSNYRIILDTGPGTPALRTITPTSVLATSIIADVINPATGTGQNTPLPLGTALDVALLIGGANGTEAYGSRLTDALTVVAAPTPVIDNVTATSTVPGVSTTLTLTGSGFDPEGIGTAQYWRARLYPTGTTSGGITPTSFSSATDTELRFLFAASVVVAGVYDVWLVATITSAPADLTNFASAKWAGTLTIAAA